MFELYASKTKLTRRSREPLTSGSVDVYRVRFEFSEDWAGLARTAVFRAGPESRSVLLDDSGECGIPWEVLSVHGRELAAGVCGTRGGEVVLPTTWASLGVIQEGAATGEPAQPPTPDLWAQALERKGDNLEYDGEMLRLRSGEKVLSEVPVAGGGGGTVAYRFGHGLKQEGLDVSVDTVSDFSGDNTLPMTAAGVQASVGNIEALLATI